MNDDGVCLEILTRAVEAVGGEHALAKLLRRDLKDVKAWLHGTRIVPMNVYFEACLLILSYWSENFGISRDGSVHKVGPMVKHLYGDHLEHRA